MFGALLWGDVMNPFLALFEVFKAIRYMMICFYIPAFGCNLWEFSLAMALVSSGILAWCFFLRGNVPNSKGKDNDKGGDKS